MRYHVLPQTTFEKLWHRVRLWHHLGSMDIKLRYRRSSLGPWWITISMAIFIATLSMVYSRLFHQVVADYLPFLACGYLLWLFISTCVNESSDVFFQSQGLIKQLVIPYTVYVMRCVYRNAIIFAHNFLIYLLLAVYLQLPVGGLSLLAVLGMLLVIMNVFWVCLLLAMIGARFRDIPPIIQSLVTLTFFISPISWMPQLIGERSMIVMCNPVTYLLDIVRSPLLGQAPAVQSWVVASVGATLGLAISFSFYHRYKSGVPFWIG